ncbi:MAG: DUF6268 family outer membrane beta-barrel protein [Bacteroidota bacterium]
MQGQSTDLARVEYTRIPQANSENSVSRFRAFVNFPIELKWEGSYLIAGVEYRNIDFDLEDPVPFNTENLQRLQLFRTTLAYTFKMKKDWRFVGKVGFEVDSNFESSQIRGEDFRFTGSLFFIKDMSGDEIKVPSRFIIGLNYTTNAGRPFPIPLLNYYRKFKPNWSYSLGTPKTNLKHTLGKRHAFQAYITLDGFFSNIQSNLVVPDPKGGTNVASNISMTLVLGGLGYEYYFTKHLLAYVYGGHTVFNEIRLRDSDRNNLYNINNDNTFYLRTGLKFKI